MTNDKIVETNTVEAEYEAVYPYSAAQNIWVKMQNESEAEFAALSIRGTGRIRTRSVHAYSYDLPDGSHLSTRHAQPWEIKDVKPAEATITEQQLKDGPIVAPKAETRMDTFRRVHDVPQTKPQIEYGREYVYNRLRLSWSDIPDGSLVRVLDTDIRDGETVYIVGASLGGRFVVYAEELTLA